MLCHACREHPDYFLGYLGDEVEFLEYLESMGQCGTWGDELTLVRRRAGAAQPAESSAALRPLGRREAAPLQESVLGAIAATVGMKICQYRSVAAPIPPLTSISCTGPRPPPPPPVAGAVRRAVHARGRHQQ